MKEELSLKIIVVEDEELILNHIVKNIQLTRLGVIIVGKAQNGMQAMELIEEHSPDILLTDIQMPVLNGLELIKHVALNYPYLKTIIISGYSEFEYAKQAIKYGVTDYLLKPLELDELREALQKIKISIEAEMDSFKSKFSLSQTGNHSPEEIVTIVSHFIKEHFNQEINLNSLANHFNFNASYLSKLFKKYYHETPVKYLLNLRINEAKHLLHSQPELEIKTIGELVGYPDQFYFSRIFKQLTGKCPSEFREQSPLN